MKKTIALVLTAAILTASVFSGCSGSGSSANSGTKSVGSTGTAAVDWPKKSVSLTVPASAGGGTDVQVRLLATAWNKSISNPSVVTNYDSIAVGIQTVSDAKNDGYTLLTTHSGFFCNYITGTLDVNPLTDLTTIACMNDMGTQCLIASTKAPYNTFTEMVEYSKSHQVTAAVSTNGASQFMMDLVQQETGAKFNYKESGTETEKLTNLAGGFIDVGVCTLDHAISYEKAGKVKVLGSFCADGKHVDESLGNSFKSFQDMGYKNIFWGTYMLVMGPKDMDPNLVEAINASLKGVVNDSDYKTGIEKQGGTVQWMSVKDSQAEVKKEFETIVKLAKASNCYVQG
ncbi:MULTISPECIES: Bug family tripartite tricarboxylate transporter substrate binding protein [Acutalibacteraceae]|uniref:Bug family tripartite tricarboxylate transporter substrate binding protein n=1 Tax=Acutalibacteraceae TaxID=3082771 RepID=UPI0013E8AA86|nr:MULTISPECIES: tripartite tricarboxylate transporter substrate binding protein [Acutalibacteraceae]